MTQIRINVDEVLSHNDVFRNCINDIGQITQKINSTRCNADRQVLSMRNMNQRLVNTGNSLNNIQNRMRDISRTIILSAESYRKNEEMLLLKNETMKKKTPTASSIDNKNSKKNQPSWFETFFTNNIDKIKNTKKYASKIITYISKNMRIPTFKIDGKYFKILNNEYYKGGNGFARWYTIQNIKNNKYPNATSAYSWGIGLKTAGKVLSVIGSGITFFQEFYKDPNLSIDRKVSNGLVEVGTTLLVAKAGATIGGAIGTLIPVPVVGTVVGAAIGVAVSLGIDALTNIKIWDGGTTTTKEAVKNIVGVGAKATTEFVGNCINGAGKFFNGLFAPKGNAGAINLVAGGVL